MGFPQRRAEGPAAMALVGQGCKLTSGGFTCPKCKALVAELPSSCHVCGLTLVSSPHLARSYHHLFPIKPFVEVSADALTQTMVRLLPPVKYSAMLYKLCLAFQLVFQVATC